MIALSSSLQAPVPLTPAKAHTLLHLTVLLWGLTAILGKLIILPAASLTFYRQGLACLGVMAYVGPREVLSVWRRQGPLIWCGSVIALHWFLFFKSIQVNGVAISVICLSTGSFFTSLLEPPLLGTRWKPRDSLAGLLVVLGVILLVSTTNERHSSADLAIGLGAALSGGGFAVFNARNLPHYTDGQISFWELFWGTAWISLAFFFCPEQRAYPWQLRIDDWIWLSILSFLCTSLTWMWMSKVLRSLSPFTMQLAVNLEPVYSILLAYLVFPDSERLSPTFYVGVLAILAVIGLHQRFTKRG